MHKTTLRLFIAYPRQGVFISHPRNPSPTAGDGDINASVDIGMGGGGGIHFPASKPFSPHCPRC